ncbi:hypothetical protein CPC08DRAFT_821564 [Agrocybe pediades]|nr:hypothetical protein CPC08DRAFT_821564 [Agrocybe pediades]
MSGLVHVDLTDTIGALQIGSLFGIFLFGLVSLQCYNYYDNYSTDGWITKTMVATVWFCELGHSIGITYEVYRATIIAYGRPELLVRFVGIGAVVALGGGVTLLVQAFFAFRLSRLFPKPYGYLGHACTAISFLRFVATVYLTVEGVTTPSLIAYRDKSGWLISTTFIVGAAVDIVIAASMLYFLVKKKGEDLDSITGLINRLIAYTIRTGLLTSVASVALVICLRVMPDNLIWLGVYTFVAKLYSNSLLSALNARKGFRDEVYRSTNSRRQKFSIPDTSFLSQSQSEQQHYPLQNMGMRSPKQPPIAIEIVDPLHARERMSNNPNLYIDGSEKLRPFTQKGVYRISESEEEV